MICTPFTEQPVKGILSGTLFSIYGDYIITEYKKSVPSDISPLYWTTSKEDTYEGRFFMKLMNLL